MYSEEEKKIAREIGYFIYEKNKFSICEAIKELKYYGIKEIKLKGDKLTIRLSRPGLLIGKKGENIEALKNKLKVIIIVEEDHLDSYMSSFSASILSEEFI